MERNLKICPYRQATETMWHVTGWCSRETERQREEDKWQLSPCKNFALFRNLYTHTCLAHVGLLPRPPMKRQRTPPPGGGRRSTPLLDFSGSPPIRWPAGAVNRRLPNRTQAGPVVGKSSKSSRTWQTVTSAVRLLGVRTTFSILILLLSLSASYCQAQGIEKAEFHIKGMYKKNVHVSHWVIFYVAVDLLVSW